MLIPHADPSPRFRNENFDLDMSHTTLSCSPVDSPLNCSGFEELSKSQGGDILNSPQGDVPRFFLPRSISFESESDSDGLEGEFIEDKPDPGQRSQQVADAILRALQKNDESGSPRKMPSPRHVPSPRTIPSPRTLSSPRKSLPISARSPKVS